MVKSVSLIVSIGFTWGQGWNLNYEKRDGETSVGATVTPDRDHYCCQNKLTYTTRNQ